MMEDPLSITLCLCRRVLLQAPLLRRLVLLLQALLLCKGPGLEEDPRRLLQGFQSGRKGNL